MYYQSRPRRYRRLALLGALCIAGVAGIAAGKDRKRALEVSGGPSPAARAAADARARDVAAARVTAETAAATDAAIDSMLSAPRLSGDAALRGLVDLAKMTPSAAGGFEVPVARQRRALLTIDGKLQAQAMALLKKSRAPMAAIVVMAPDGRILALAGHKQGPPEVEQAYDLATSRWAPAASVFKIVTASALLQAGVGAEDKVCFHGGLRSVVASNLVDDPRKDGRCESLSFAVAESNNAIVGKLFHQHLDADRLARTARALGFGSAPQFALAADPSEIDVPQGDLEQARFAAGFWSSQLTALDGALLANTVATGGMRVVPRIVDEVVDARGGRHEVVAVAPARVMPRAVAAEIGKMMVRTCDEGTASRVFRSRRSGSALTGVKIAGKTGSLSQDKPFMGYSWFVAYAPADAPQVVVSVVLGNPETWWLKAHMAARELLETALAKSGTRTASRTAGRAK